MRPPDTNHARRGEILAPLPRGCVSCIFQRAPVHNREMSDDPVEQPTNDRDTQQASSEATERTMRLQLWLNGLLAGGPTLAEAVTPWREGPSIYRDPAETLSGDQDEVPEDDTKVIEEPLMAAISRLRQRREQSGNAPPEIHEEEQRRRLTEVVEKVKADRRAGGGFTPMDIVLAARYIEGLITPGEYRSR
jgi:hypothetical protein